MIFREYSKHRFITLRVSGFFIIGLQTVSVFCLIFDLKKIPLWFDRKKKYSNSLSKKDIWMRGYRRNYPENKKAEI